MARPRNYPSQHSHETAEHAPPYPERKQTHHGHSNSESHRHHNHNQHAPAPGPPLPQRSQPGSTGHLASAGHSTHHGHQAQSASHHGHKVQATSHQGHKAQAASHPPAPSPKPSAKKLSKIRDPRVLEQAEVNVRLYRLKRRANWLDSQFSCCCGMLRFGVESLIGLIPVIGDFAGIFLAITYMNTVRRKFDIPPSIVSQMTINIAIDFCVGLVPLLGDLLDVFFKANMRNYMLVEKYVMKQRESGHDLEMGQRSEGGGNGKASRRARIGEYIPDIPLNLNPDNIAKVATAGIQAGKRARS